LGLVELKDRLLFDDERVCHAVLCFLCYLLAVVTRLSIDVPYTLLYIFLYCFVLRMSTCLASSLDLTMSVDLEELQATLSQFDQQFRSGSSLLSLPEQQTKETNNTNLPKEEKTAETPISSDNGADEATKDLSSASNAPAKQEVPAKDPSDVFRIRSQPESEASESVPIDGKESKWKDSESAETAEDATPSAEIAKDTTSTESGESAMKSDRDLKDSTDDSTAATDSKLVDEKNLLAGNDGTAKVENLATSMKISSVTKEMAENICVVFPSALGAAESLSVPFLTIQPSFLKAKGTRNIVKALDGILRSFSPSTSFLSSDFIPAEWSKLDKPNEPPSIEKMCLHRLRSLMHVATSSKDDKSPVLLSLLLLIRIELAVYLAFREKVGNDNIVENAEKAKPDSREMTQGRIAGKLLSELVSHMDSYANLSRSLDVVELQTILSPMVEAGFCSLQRESDASGAKLQNLLITPLPLLLQLLSNFKASDRPSFDSLDNAWKDTLQKAHVALSKSRDTAKAATKDAVVTAAISSNKLGGKDDATPEEPKATHSSTTASGGLVQSRSSDWMDDSTPRAATGATATPTSNSKKKKNKRKRNKVSITALSYAPSQQQSNIFNHGFPSLDLAETPE
jgi:hypothetical protein